MLDVPYKNLSIIFRPAFHDNETLTRGLLLLHIIVHFKLLFLIMRLYMCILFNENLLHKIWNYQAVILGIGYLYYKKILYFLKSFREGLVFGFGWLCLVDFKAFLVLWKYLVSLKHFCVSILKGKYTYYLNSCQLL